MLIGRFEGPLAFRFIFQPLVAATLALRDAREGRPPYFLWAAITDPVRRRELMRLAWQDIGKVFVLAFLLDVVYELIVYRWIYPGQAVIVALILAVIPYLLVLGLVARILRRVRAT